MPKGFSALLATFLALFALSGCGSPFTGSLTGINGNGGGPTPNPGQAQITSLSPANAPAGTTAFTLTATGLNFTPTTTVIWDNTSLTTTYVSPTVLQAQVTASLIAKPETVSIIPSPIGTLNFGVNFTVTVPPLTGNSYSLSMVTVQANDMAFDPANQLLYLSIASGNPTNANSITALNPQTGLLGASAPTSTEPGKLSISSDGSYIYAGLNAAASVQRLTLPALQPDISIPLGSGNYGPYYAIDVASEPGSPHSVAVSRGVTGISPKEQGGVLLYDDAVARPQSVPGPGPGPGPIDSLLWNPNSQALYGVDTETSTGLYIMSVTTAGVQLQSGTQPAIKYAGGNVHFDSTTGYLYSDSGDVIDPSTNATIGSFSFNAIQGGSFGLPLMVPDGTLNIAYFLLQTVDELGTSNYALEAFDLTHFTFLGAIPIPNVSGTPARLIRWGTNGLAFLTPNFYGAGANECNVYLISGAFVTSPAPQ